MPITTPEAERSFKAEQKKRRRAAGKAAALAAREHEQLVKGELEALKQQLLVAHFHHNEPRWVPRGPGRWVRAAASGADFEGFLVSRCAFGLEAKTTGADEDGDARRFDGERITELQRAHLDTLVHVGAPALLALEWRLARGERQQFLIPWGLVPWQGRKSFTLDDVQLWRIAGELREVLKIHFLPAVAR